MDCYTDPLGWIDQPSTGVTEGSSLVKLHKCVTDLKRLFSSIIDAGRGCSFTFFESFLFNLMDYMRLKLIPFAVEMVGDGKTRFTVAIDSVIKFSLWSFRHEIY